MILVSASCDVRSSFRTTRSCMHDDEQSQQAPSPELLVAMSTWSRSQTAVSIHNNERKGWMSVEYGKTSGAEKEPIAASVGSASTSPGAVDATKEDTSCRRSFNKLGDGALSETDPGQNETMRQRDPARPDSQPRHPSLYSPDLATVQQPGASRIYPTDYFDIDGSSDESIGFMPAVIHTGIEVEQSVEEHVVMTAIASTTMTRLRKPVLFLGWSLSQPRCYRAFMSSGGVLWWF